MRVFLTRTAFIFLELFVLDDEHVRTSLRPISAQTVDFGEGDHIVRRAARSVDTLMKIEMSTG